MTWGAAARWVRSSQGASAVEFALVLPLLLTLVLGSIDWGYYFYARQVITNSAREGARAGSLQSLDDSTAYAEAGTRARDYVGRGGLDSTLANVAVTLTGDSVNVAVTYPIGSITGFTEIVLPASATAVAEMRR